MDRPLFAQLEHPAAMSGRRTAHRVPRCVLGVFLVVVGCGGSSTKTAVPIASSGTTSTATPPTWSYSNAHVAPPPGAVEQVMQHDLYGTSTITVTAGRVAIHLVNNEATGTSSPIRHNMVITDDVGHRYADSTDVEPGTDLVFTIDVPPGMYRFLCSVDGHANAGMKGTITAT